MNLVTIKLSKSVVESLALLVLQCTMYNVLDPSLAMRVKLERGLFGGGLKVEMKSQSFLAFVNGLGTPYDGPETRTELKAESVTN